MLIVRHPHYLLPHSLRQLFPQCHDQLRPLQIAMLVYKLRNIDWFADVNRQIVPQVVIIPVLQTDRYYIDRFLLPELVIGAEGNAEDAFT